jgi:hypothetical protein
MNNKAPQTENKMHGFFTPKITLASGENRTVLPERVIGLRASKEAGSSFFKARFLASFKGQGWAIPPQDSQGYPHHFNKIAQVIINKAVTFLFFKLRSLHKIHSKKSLKSLKLNLTLATIFIVAFFIYKGTNRWP